MTHSISPLGNLLSQALATIRQYNLQKVNEKKLDTLDVPNVANILLFAYEQLRNASENIEDHLLVQNSIKRFFKRNNLLAHKMPEKALGKELLIELTQTGYFKNNTILISKINELDKLIGAYHNIYREITKRDSSISKETAETWILEILTVKSEQLINNPIRILSFAHFAHTHFSSHIDYEETIGGSKSVSQEDYPTLLYISIHKSLLKSDDANVRSSLLDLSSIPLSNIDQFIEFNKKYDFLIAQEATTKVSRFVAKNGAPLRIIRSTFFDEKAEQSIYDIKNETKIVSLVDTQIDTEYENVRKSVNKGIIKSIIFLLITKAIVGVLIEIPYDIAVTGTIIVLPLIVNLLFPPLFLALTALTFRIPGELNKVALKDYIQSMLYSTASGSVKLKYIHPSKNSDVFNVVFGIVFVGAFYLVASRLAALGFNVVQGLLFIIFFSTASFLGYRLTLQIKELEIINTSQGFIALVRDFLYTPFIILGKRISYRFGKLNLIGQILDLAIDLPLKTFVRLIRQWMIFLNDKKEELMQ
jgi:hypothetical protein